MKADDIGVAVVFGFLAWIAANLFPHMPTWIGLTVAFSTWLTMWFMGKVIVDYKETDERLKNLAAEQKLLREHIDAR
jgi:hypothetical protein